MPFLDKDFLDVVMSPTPYTLHTTPLHPTPYTLRPTPWMWSCPEPPSTLNPKLSFL